MESRRTAAFTAVVFVLLAIAYLALAILPSFVTSPLNFRPVAALCVQSGAVERKAIPDIVFSYLTPA